MERQRQSSQNNPGQRRARFILLLLLSVWKGLTAIEVTASVNPARAGENVTFLVTPPTAMRAGSWAVGDSVLVVTWLGDQQAVFPGHEGRARVDIRTGALRLTSVTIADSGTYVIQSSDPALRANTSLTVLEPITNVTVNASRTELVEFTNAVSLTCSKSGSSVSVRWMNGSSVVTPRAGVLLEDGNHTLTIQNVTRYDAGPISCHVTNALGNTTSQPITLIISYGPEDMSLALRGSLLVGSNLTLVCQVSSQPLALLDWLFNGESLNETGQDTLQLSGVEERHSGLYSCRAFNNKTRRWTSVTKHIVIRAPPLSKAQQWKIYPRTMSCIFIVFLLSILS